MQRVLAAILGVWLIGITVIAVWPVVAEPPWEEASTKGSVTERERMECEAAVQGRDSAAIGLGAGVSGIPEEAFRVQTWREWVTVLGTAAGDFADDVHKFCYGGE